MDGATLQSKIYSGYAKAAQRIGQLTSLYRPASATAPIGTALTTFQAAFNQDDEFSKPNKYGNSVWRGLFDGSQAQVGDYLVTPDSTFFIASMQHLLPVQCVECNRVIRIARPTQPTGVGAVGYGGDIPSTETVLMQGWPASVLQGTKGEKNPVGLPGDERIPWYAILLPYWSGVTIRNADVITDDLNRRYIVSSPELTDMGWRITASMVGA